MTPETRATCIDALRVCLDTIRQDIRLDYGMYAKPHQWRRRRITAKQIARLRAAIRELQVNDELEILWQRAGYTSSLEVHQYEGR